MARERRFDSKGAGSRGAKNDMVGGTMWYVNQSSPREGANRFGSGDLISVAFLVTTTKQRIDGVTF